MEDSAIFCVECGAKQVRTLSQTTLKSTESEIAVRNRAPGRTETVYLDTLDGFEFEDFCGRVFEKLGYGRVQVMPYSGDKGRDLIIHTSQATKIVVECKHHPHGIIGRPVIQKLHSAVITEGASKGMLVTTGKFSEEAINHVREIHPTIELIDMNLLRDLAERAGIHLARSGEQTPLSYFPISNGNNVAMSVISSVSKRIVSHPHAALSLFNLQESRLRLRPVYQVRYNIHHDFETSVGVIHSIHLNDQELLVDGSTGQPVVGTIGSFLRGTPTSQGNGTNDAVRVAERGSFRIDQTTLASKAKQAIARLHSKEVSYYGRNNIHYKTVCTPGDRSIVIRDVKQIFIPEWTISLGALSKRYTVTLVEKPQDVLLLGTELSTCGICRMEITNEILLCNSCGNIVHKGRSHGYECKNCTKSICRHCTYWIRRLLFFKMYLCEPCALEKERLKGKKIKRLAPDAPQIH